MAKSFGQKAKLLHVMDFLLHSSDEEHRVTLYEEDKWPKDWKDRLYEKDFASTSGWIYRVNGEMPNVGIGAYTVNDGDEIDLVFVLFDGE